MTAKYFVGQVLIRRDINEDLRRDAPREVKVVRVGRTLVDVEGAYGHIETYRMDQGVINDDYGHSWLQTPEEFADEKACAAAIERLRELGLRLDYGSKRFQVATLLRFIEAIEAEEVDRV